MKQIFLLCMAAATVSACISEPFPKYGAESVVCDPYQAQEALDRGSVEVIVRKPLSGDATLSIPKIYSADTAVIITIDANGKNLTIAQGRGNDDYPRLSLILLSAVKDLTIDTPDIQVTIEGDVEGTLTAQYLSE